MDDGITFIIQILLDYKYYNYQRLIAPVTVTATLSGTLGLTNDCFS